LRDVDVAGIRRQQLGTVDSEEGVLMPQASPLSPASVLGVGAVTPLGRDLQAIARKLAEPPTDGSPQRRVNDDLLSAPTMNLRMRRADRFARMAAVTAMDAWTAANSACAGVSMERVGLIVTSGFGPHCRGFRFLDGILDCGDNEALPTDFSHSVHSAAAAYVTEMLNLRGPSLTTTDFEIGFEQAVLLAQCWLDQEICDRVIVGAVEELGEVLIDCAARMLRHEQPFVPGEGAVFLTLAPSRVAGIALLEAAPQPREVDLLTLSVPDIPSRTPCPPAVRPRRTTTFSPYFGHSPSSCAFQLLGGFLSLREGRPLGQMIHSDCAAPGNPDAVDSTATFKPSCDPRVTSLLLTKPRL
jgi:hypothetical protein